MEFLVISILLVIADVLMMVRPEFEWDGSHLWLIRSVWTGEDYVRRRKKLW